MTGAADGDSGAMPDELFLVVPDERIRAEIEAAGPVKNC
jgi:hypothetical protein